MFVPGNWSSASLIYRGAGSSNGKRWLIEMTQGGNLLVQFGPGKGALRKRVVPPARFKSGNIQAELTSRVQDKVSKGYTVIDSSDSPVDFDVQSDSDSVDSRPARKGLGVNSSKLGAWFF